MDDRTRGELNRPKVPSNRLKAVRYIFALILLVLSYRLYQLQVQQSDFYAALAEKNRLREIPILAPRGLIYDREGRLIADSYLSPSALLHRDGSRDLYSDVDLIAKGLHMQPEELRERIRKLSFGSQYRPIFLKNNLTPDEVAFIAAHHANLPQLDYVDAFRRRYSHHDFMAHLIGYVGEISEDMLDQPQWEVYNPGDLVGKSGVERAYNQLLMGKNGSRQIVVDSQGREVARLAEVPAIPGRALNLTVDIDLQGAAERALEGDNGAIVALNPKTGEILAMASRPGFDPNDFTASMSPEKWNGLVTDENHPLLNKAIQAQLAPGSVFKIITATAGLQEGIAQNMKVTCNGGLSFYGRYFRCWVAKRHGAHGRVDITKGIYQSCDVFFYTLANKLGITRIANYASAFGLGQKTGVDLPQEAHGLVPSEEWKIRTFRRKWQPGETISVGIGQGAVTVTPLQLARAIGAIASGGFLRRPHVARSDIPQELRPATNIPDEIKISIEPKNWEIVTDAMADVTSSVGTAATAHLQGIDFAGKTGSAQTVSSQAKAHLRDRRRAIKDNAWFVGVSPRRNPEIVVGVLLEGGEHGSLAAIAASQVVRAYVEKERNRTGRSASGTKEMEIGAVWHMPSAEDRSGQALQAGRFYFELAGEPHGNPNNHSW